jgi:hypothetical protein
VKAKALFEPTKTSKTTLFHFNFIKERKKERKRRKEKS